ncbi:MAG: 5-(carboxyamino)imidazole ribonucleotide synthase [Rhodanobacteraceae bacterium]
MSRATGDRVAILGGGQLARMLVQAGVPLGASFRVVDKSTDVCAAQVAPVQAVEWSNQDALVALADEVDVITFDYENVPAGSVEQMARHTQVHPNPRALAVAQDRMSEKALFESVGLATATHAAVSTREDLDAALAVTGCPAILKTRRLGYDGKGQFRLHSEADADAAWQELGQAARQHGLILEAMIDFQREVSVVAARGRSGEFRAWPLVQNWHDDGILSISMAPAAVTTALHDEALKHARAIAEELDYVGVFALELFVDGDRLLGNEMAPRVHNSGHWSIEGAVTSQFENHVRAVLDMPLGCTDARGFSLMFNWIGEMPRRDVALRHGGVHWHDYGKSPRPGRKLGHATICADDAGLLLDRAEALARDLGCEARLQPVRDWVLADPAA